MKSPRAILFDLDDTILVAFGPAQSQWQVPLAAFADQLGPIEATTLGRCGREAGAGISLLTHTALRRRQGPC
jgi:hypothetical protein